jgi:hypothetical protein
MKDSLVLQQMQDGLIEFDTAFTLIATAARRQVAGDSRPLEPLVRRNASGRVVLVNPDQIVATFWVWSACGSPCPPLKWPMSTTSSSPPPRRGPVPAARRSG